MIKKFEWEQLKTLQSKEILSELVEASEEPMAKMLIADTGLGKTNAIELFKQMYPSHTYVVTLGESYKRNGLLDELCDLLGSKTYRGKNMVTERIRSIAGAVKDMAEAGHVPVIILDEFENARLPILKSMKELYDAIIKYCSIVLIGTEQLIEQFKKKSVAQSIPQLLRRFKAGTRMISPLRKARDFKPFFEKYISGNTDIQDLLLVLCNNYGELKDYLYPALNHCNKKAIKLTAEVFKNYHKIK